MAYLSKSAAKRKTHEVELKSAACKARIKELSGKQAVNYQIDMLGKDGKADVQKMRDAASKLIAQSVVDADGNFEFDEQLAGDLPAPVSAELVEHINRINNMGAQSDSEDEEKKES